VRRARRPVVWVALATLLALAPGGCSATPPGSATGTDLPASADPFAQLDPATADLMREHGHRPAGTSRQLPITVGDLQDHPWLLYLEVSRQAGLDFGALEGSSGELTITPIIGPAADTELVVLRVGGRAVGAWISPGGSSSGVLPVNTAP
jgi:hypothetical protein